MRPTTDARVVIADQAFAAEGGPVLGKFRDLCGEKTQVAFDYSLDWALWSGGPMAGTRQPPGQCGVFLQLVRILGGEHPYAHAILPPQLSKHVGERVVG
jgi:hypothetical protein